jgi:hypothetical protein
MYTTERPSFVLSKKGVRQSIDRLQSGSDFLEDLECHSAELGDIDQKTLMAKLFLISGERLLQNVYGFAEAQIIDMAYGPCSDRVVRLSVSKPIKHRD